VREDEAREELKKIVGEKLSKATTIRLAYRGFAGSLICIMALSENDLEVFTCCKNDISVVVSDFNWFWRQLRNISNLTGAVLIDVKAEVKTSTFTDIVKDPYVSGPLTTIIWVSVNEITKNAVVSSIFSGVVLLFYGIALYYWRVKKKG